MVHVMMAKLRKILFNLLGLFMRFLLWVNGFPYKGSVPWVQHFALCLRNYY